MNGRNKESWLGEINPLELSNGIQFHFLIKINYNCHMRLNDEETIN